MSSRVPNRSPARFAVLLLAACSGGSGAESNDSGTSTADAANTEKADAQPGGSCASDAVPDAILDPAGSIWLIEGENTVHGHTVPTLGARLLSAPPVPPRALVAQQGDCAIYAPSGFGFCDPPCAGFCAEDGSCMAYPELRSAGSIEVTGLVGALRLDADASGYYQASAEYGETLFVDGACVEVSAPGQSAPGFALQTSAPADLALDVDTVTFVDGSDYTLQWPTGAGGTIRLFVEVGKHAAAGTVMLCESPDDGQLVVPAALLAQFPYYSDGPGPNSGYALIARIARAVTASEPIVELTLAAQQSHRFVHLP